ncbi:hypothetical protein CcaCcLH18_11422 [Colletotrichum camelliae]|nr:hypothetical protein CcaCcLH18_11422 [Colletotrichum camelliae]
MHPNMSAEDQQFEELLKAFKNAHGMRTRSLEAHMDEAKRILESEIDGLQQTMNVKHTPISARLKDADKALRTLRRRHEDRKQLRELKGLVENRGQKWAEYCKEWSMEDKINEAEPFTDIDQMFNAMHDLAGIRISVYFPTDIPKVVEFLQGDRFKIVHQPSRKGGLTRDFQKIRKLVERQSEIHRHGSSEHKHGDANRMGQTDSVPELTFAGYKATHVVIRLSDLGFDKHSQLESGTNIEVQIGSIVMHAWSDIEHDILYKPSEKEKASEDVVQMLDLINGIVMTGEVALQQLSRVAAAEARRQVANRTRLADNWHDLVTWFYTYFKDKDIHVPPEIEWSARYFSPLFEILRATDEHNYGRVEALLNEGHPQPQPEAYLPLKLLRNLGSEEFSDPIFRPPEYATTWSARYWATCLVNVANIALYMECSVFRSMFRHSEENKTLHQKRPTFAEFVDILHPRPQRHSNRDIVMIEFCKHVLATNFRDLDAVAAVQLAAAGYVVRPQLSRDAEKDLSSPPPIFVPAMLKHLTQDTVSSFDITLSLIGDDVYYDKSQYFIPSREGNTWKPARREPGKKWVITKTPFNNDEELKFGDTEAQWEVFTDHLCNVLGVKTYPAEIRALRNLAQKLKIEDNVDKLRDLIKITSALGTKDADRVLKFLEVSANVADTKGFNELIKLAELARAFDTMDAEELQEYHDLARDHSTRDVDELRALKRLADRYDTHDPRVLKEFRSEEKDKELPARGRRGADENGDWLDPTKGIRTPWRRPSPTPVREVSQGGWRAHDSVQYRP